MSSGFTEDDMRRALGLSETPGSPPTSHVTPPAPANKVKPEARVVGKSKPRSPKLRVTLLVSKEFEGDTVEFIHDADTLSQFDAEQDAKKLAKKEKYRFFEVVSIKPIG
ncbi:hypothetical protein [Pseudomonas psychrophila]|uniref:Uncharacterized protein n=1 Tax=Pseudomonas psychrophila TaxID=122355 RepID=A0A8I1FR72_9PSED|nr:hypothetical protein [Pseudomonas psychrophila]AVX93280.1 hypothetical protein PkP19E3_34690 [Pseudomonas koreensis]MBJ2259162.1 hypothetical protein [Pseudomonas psychrophila]